MQYILPDLQYLKSKFRTSPTGTLMRREASKQANPNPPKKSSQGQNPKVRIKGRNYATRHVLFKLAHGREPVGAIKHVDGDRANITVENLTDVLIRSEEKQTQKHPLI